ncbi:MAG: hypothetical protein C4548_14295 [Desulfobacteraceae bacterium]|nr:MAG: hypothetical protein C4548_14295 [Desulfobacteraceae bacterium]
MKQTPFILFAVLLLLIATDLHAETKDLPEQQSQDKSSVENVTLFPGFLSLFLPLPAASTIPEIRMPLVYDRLPGDKSCPIDIKGGNMRYNGHTIIMEDLTIFTSPLIFRNIRPEGSETGPGFGTVYQNGGKRVISGSITIEPLP